MANAPSSAQKLFEAIRSLRWRPTASPKVAVLIDGDNVSPKIVSALFNHIACIGDPTTRRVYVNVAGRGNKWSAAMADQSLSPVHVSSVSSGKNAADIALTIDAMDLIHSKRADAFVIVSSDADYTRLATRIREAGYAIHGYGAAHTPVSFQRACSSFMHLEELGTGAASGAGRAGKWKLAPTDAEATLVLAVLRLGGGSDAVDLSRLGEYLRRHEPYFDPRVFRCRTLSELVDKLESLDLG
jgi:uncharacterized protein (TIGR00288 family)